MLLLAGLAHHSPPLGGDGRAGDVDVIDADGQVAEARAELVGVGAPVVGEFQDSGVLFIAVAHEGQGVGPTGIVLAAQQPHAQHLDVEAQGALQIAHPEHGVKQSHRHWTSWSHSDQGAAGPGHGRAVAQGTQATVESPP